MPATKSLTSPTPMIAIRDLISRARPRQHFAENSRYTRQEAASAHGNARDFRIMPFTRKKNDRQRGAGYAKCTISCAQAQHMSALIYARCRGDESAAEVCFISPDRCWPATPLRRERAFAMSSPQRGEPSRFVPLLKFHAACLVLASPADTPSPPPATMRR